MTHWPNNMSTELLQLIHEDHINALISLTLCKLLLKYPRNGWSHIEGFSSHSSWKNNKSMQTEMNPSLALGMHFVKIFIIYVVLIDYEKAFDMALHGTLLNKLCTSEIDDIDLRIIENFSTESRGWNWWKSNNRMLHSTRRQTGTHSICNF